jgi:hypothetical protein
VFSQCKLTAQIYPVQDKKKLYIYIPVYSSTEIICKFMGINRDEKGVLKIKATFFSKDNK